MSSSFNKTIKQSYTAHKQSNFFVIVSKDSDKGYWEIDYHNQHANFRHFSNQRLPDDVSITDHTDKYNTVEDFVKAGNFSHIKKINDNKVLFSGNVFCDISNCNRPAKVRYSNGVKHCTIHKEF